MKSDFKQRLKNVENEISFIREWNQVSSGDSITTRMESGFETTTRIERGFKSGFMTDIGIVQK
jgi:hypothetical protein